MLRPLSPHGQQMVRLLSDGEWHKASDLVVAAAVFVPYGEAVRTARSMRARKNAGAFPTEGYESRTLDEFTCGSRELTRKVLYNWFRDSKVQSRGVLGCREYRLPEETTA